MTMEDCPYCVYDYMIELYICHVDGIETYEEACEKCEVIKHEKMQRVRKTDE